MSDSSGEVQSILSGTAVVLLGFIISAVLRFLLKLVTARYLGPEVYGEFAIGRVFLTTAVVLTLLGLHNGLARYLPRAGSGSEERGFLVSSFLIGGGISILTAAVGIIYSDSIAVFLNQPQAAIFVRIFSMAIPALTVIRLTVAVMRGYEKANSRIAFDKIGLPSIQAVLVILLIATDSTSVSLALATMSGFVVVALVGLLWLHRNTNLFDRSTAATRHYRILLDYSLPLLLSGAMFQILARMDVFLISYFTGNSTQVGIYNVIYPLATQMTILLSASGFLVLPVISRLKSAGREAEMKRVYSELTKWMVIVSIPPLILGLVYPSEVIRITFGDEYATGALALQILILGFTTHTFFGPNGEILKSLGKTNLFLILTVATATVNVVLNIALIPTYGFVGAAVATTISYTVFNLIVTASIYLSSGLIPASSDTYPVIIIGGSTFLFGTWFITIVEGITGKILFLTGLLCLYGFIAIYFGFGSDERTITENALKAVGVEPSTTRGVLEKITRSK